MDSDADDACEAERPERGGTSLFGAVMNRSGQHSHRGRGRARSYEAPGCGDNVAGGDAIDVVEATRFPSASDNNCNMSTPSPKSRQYSQAPTTGSRSGRRGGGLFGDLGGDGGSSGGRFAGVASPGGYGIMDILNNMDEDSNFDKVESPSKSSKGVDNDGGGEKEPVDEAPPKWKFATFVIPRWLSTATTTGSSVSPCTTFPAGVSASPRSEEDEGGGGRRVQIKQESQSGEKDDVFDEGDDDVYDLPTQPPADAKNKKRKRSASDAEAVPSSNDPATGSTEASSDALAPKAALTVGVLDWSLKRRLRLECFPRRALPLSSSSSGHEAVDRLAARIFLHPGGGFDEMGNNDSIDYVRSAAGMPVEDTTTIAAAQWKAAQMYWRHPAIYPLPPQLLVGSSKGGRIIHQAAGGGSFSNIGSSSTRNNNPAKKALRFASSSTRTSTEDEAVAIREAADKIQQRQAASLSAMGFGSAAVAEFGEAGSTLLALMDDPSEIVRRRQLEWTEAFRSMYYTWLERIDGLRMVDHELLSVDAVARTYFYLVSQSQTILFRCQVQHHRKDDDVEDEDDAYTVEPVIVLSSTTSGLRSELRHMGVSIFVLDDESIERPGQDQDEEGQDERAIDNLFDESVFDFKADSSERSKVEEDEARKVREELEALRRAGAQGNAAGAEISVSIGKKKESMSQEVRGKDRDQIFRPLYVKGDEDCMAVFELLLNTRGCFFGGEDDDDGAKSDVPLLLHRSLGPTKNASIGTLSETMRLDENYNELKMLRDREVKISDAPADDETLAKLQINGPILPCAFRDLISASICHLLLDLDETEEVEMREEEDSIANDDTAGSHFLVWHPARQEGFGADNSLTVTKSTKSSERAHMHSNKKVAKRLAMHKRETGNPTSSHFNGGDLDMDMDELSMRDGECQGDGRRRIAVSNCGSQQNLKQVIWMSNRRNALTYSTASALD